ncbi:MAG: gamma-glutamylcyclotransferase family protein, partial [Pirellulales bacterium]
KVWQAVVGRDFPSTPARLAGYQIFPVAGAVYPGIIKYSPPPSTLHFQPSTVPGLLYLDADSASLARLDRFEDDFYRRQSITVTCDDGRQLEAQAYVVPEESRHVLTAEPWSGDDFVARGDLDRFLACFAGFQRVRRDGR